MLDREFIPTEHANLGDNFERIKNNMAPKTRANYSKKFKNIIERITKSSDGSAKPNYNNLLKELEIIEHKRETGLLKRPSMRQYKASILYGFTMCYECMKDADANDVDHDDEYNKIFSSLAKTLSIYDLNKLYGRVSNWSSEASDVAKNLDNMAHLRSNTSSRKAKLFDESLLNILLSGNEPRLDLLRMFLRVNIILGLRPNEWYSCKIITAEEMERLKNQSNSPLDRHINASSEDATFIKQSLAFLELPYPGIESSIKIPSDNASVLVVKNSKDSHGRANGSFRYILLDKMDDENLEQVHSLISMLHKRNESVAKEREVAADEYCFDSYVIQPLQNQLKYELESNPSCQIIINRNYRKKLASYVNEKTRAIKLGKNWSRKSPIKMYPTLYSTRHQAVSNAKASLMNPVLMAALFGHASIVTAERHYGKQSDGWGGSMVEPHPDSIMKVVNGLTENQISNCLALASTAEILDICNQIEAKNNVAAEHSGNGDVDRELDLLMSNSNVIHVKLNNAIRAAVSNGSNDTGAERKSLQKAAHKPATRKK